MCFVNAQRVTMKGRSIGTKTDVQHDRLHCQNGVTTTKVGIVCNAMVLAIIFSLRRTKMSHGATDVIERSEPVTESPCSCYYADEWVTIYHADAREVLPSLADYILVTDPPYGVDLGKADQRRDGHGLGKGAYEGIADDYETWREAVLPVISEAVKRAKRGCVFTGPHLQEQPKADAIGGVYCPAGAGRHGWGFKTFLPVMFYGTAPNLQNGAQPNTLRSSETAEKNGHPCPKPLGWMSWLIGLASEPGDLIVDPFMGSGTTLRAAKDLNRRAVGIELSERYCEIAVGRMAQSVLNFEANSSC